VPIIPGEKMKSLGVHILVELFNCNRNRLKDLELIKEMMTKAALAARATIICDAFHQFSNEGVSGIIMLAESHFSIHTWPEHCYAAVDLFTCGKQMDPWVAFDILAQNLEAEHKVYLEVKRGEISNSQFSIQEK